jgi:hypothetical protein
MGVCDNAGENCLFCSPEQLNTADGGLCITRICEQLDDCGLFDAVAQVLYSEH